MVLQLARATIYLGMAKFGMALDLGSRGRGFKSLYSDHKPNWFKKKLGATKPYRECLVR